MHVFINRYVLIACSIFVYLAMKVSSFSRFSAYSTIRGSTRRLSDNWLDRPEEQVVHLPDSSAFIPSAGQQTLFDALYNSDTASSKDTSRHSISQMSLREISLAYQFSMEFLGDFAVQLGCQAPIDTDAKIANLMTGEQIFSLLNAINTLDSFEANAGYDSVSLQELAYAIGISKERILKIAKLEEVNLPFGMNTVLHMSVAEKVKERALLELEEESNDSRPVIDVLEDETDEYGESSGGFISIG